MIGGAWTIPSSLGVTRLHTMTTTEPVGDWATDFDVLDPGYIEDPFRVWNDLRQTCPIAHTDRRGSNWLPTRYEDVTAIAHDIEHFSSLKVAVIPFPGDEPPPETSSPTGSPRSLPTRRFTPGPVACSFPGSRTTGLPSTSPSPATSADR